MWEESESSSTKRGGSRSIADPAKLHDAVFQELMQECKHSAPGARLSARLRTALERMSPRARRALCDRKQDGCAPLFVACKRGNVEIVEYLIHVCAADIEQRGVYEVPDDRSVHTVTPLWCAAVTGRLEVLRVLADAGADVNAGSDSGSTPVRSACFMTHLDVVRFLVARGADIHRPNHNGGTCLINSVQSVRLCAFLLDHGAQVNAHDTQMKTVLHYAIQEHRMETTRLLLEHGADPHLASRAGDDALRTACLKGASQIVSLLAGRVRYEPARMADAYELLGSTQLDEFNDVTAALAAWRRATAIRHGCGAYIPKRPVRAPHRALGHAREWRSLAELEQAATDMDSLRTQSLLVVARVLGVEHKDTVFRLMYRGASYADAFRYQRCIELWTWALQIRIEKDSLLATDTCHTACALTRLMLDARGGRLERGRGLPAHQDVLRVFRLLADDLPGRLPARAGGAAGAQGAGGHVRPRAALRDAPDVPAAADGAVGGGAARERGGRARARACRRAERAHGRHAAAPVRVVPQRHSFHVLRRRNGRNAHLPERGGGVAAAGVRRGRARAQRGALDAAARGRHPVQLQHGAGGGAAGGRRAPGPAQQVRRLAGGAGAAEPRLARARGAARVAGVPGGARAAGRAPPRARARAARHAARLPRHAPALAAPAQSPRSPPRTLSMSYILVTDFSTLTLDLV